MSDIIKFVKKIPLFQGLQPSQVRELIAEGEEMLAKHKEHEEAKKARKYLQDRNSEEYWTMLERWRDEMQDL